MILPAMKHIKFKLFIACNQFGKIHSLTVRDLKSSRKIAKQLSWYFALTMVHNNDNYNHHQLHQSQHHRYHQALEWLFDDRITNISACLTSVEVVYRPNMRERKSSYTLKVIRLKLLTICHHIPRFTSVSNYTVRRV